MRLSPCDVQRCVRKRAYTSTLRSSLRSRNRGGRVPRAALGPAAIHEAGDRCAGTVYRYASDGVTACEGVDTIRVTLVALCRGAALSEHRAAGPVTIHVLEGIFGLSTVSAGDPEARSGELIALDNATEDCALLLTTAMSG